MWATRVSTRCRLALPSPLPSAASSTEWGLPSCSSLSVAPRGSVATAGSECLERSEHGRQCRTLPGVAKFFCVTDPSSSVASAETAARTPHMRALMNSAPAGMPRFAAAGIVETKHAGVASRLVVNARRRASGDARDTSWGGVYGRPVLRPRPAQATVVLVAEVIDLHNIIQMDRGEGQRER